MANPIQADSTLATAMLSPVLAGHVRTWVDHRSALWQVDEPDRLAELL